MRLLNVDTLDVETFYDSDVPKYAALSHTWGEGEVTFQDIKIDRERTKRGWAKVLMSAAEAVKHDCKYIWIDTCCIDKSSSSELSEDINSMFRSYRESAICIVFLEDIMPEPEEKIVVIECDGESVTPPGSPVATLDTFIGSRWFTRGWTLQELIAPTDLTFYDSSWHKIGSKEDLRARISKATAIDIDVLDDYRALHHKSIARRMSWASGRRTTRSEDMAYCLLGIFDVSLPLLYGEGHKAFVRLQEEIMRCNYDHSLFAWKRDFSDTLFGTIHGMPEAQTIGWGIFAPHPIAFSNSTNIVPHSIRSQPHQLTNRGVELHVRVLREKAEPPAVRHFAILHCGYKDEFGTALAIPIIQTSSSSSQGSLISGAEFCRAPSMGLRLFEHKRISSLKLEKIFIHRYGPVFRPHHSSSFFFHRCYLRGFDQQHSLKLVKGRYCKTGIDGSKIGYEHGTWDYASKSMTWPKSWRGIRAILLFSEEGGPTLTLRLEFACPAYSGLPIPMSLKAEQIQHSADLTKSEILGSVSLRQVLTEETDFGPLSTALKSEASLPTGNRVFTFRLSRERSLTER